MSFLPLDWQWPSSTTAAASSAHHASMIDDEVFREFQQSLRSVGHVTNLATKQLLLQRFLAEWHEKSACELHCSEQVEKNYTTDDGVASGHGSGIVSLLSNAFSLGSEVEAFQQNEESAADRKRASLGARRSSTCSTMSTVTSHSNSRSASSTKCILYECGQPSQNLAPGSTTYDAASRREMFRQSRRLSQQFSTSVSATSGIKRMPMGETRRSSMPSNAVVSNMHSAYMYSNHQVLNTDAGTTNLRVERRRSSLLSVFGGHRSSMGSSQSIRRLSSIGSARSVSIGSSGPLHMNSLRDVDEVSKEGDDESTTSRSRSSEHRPGVSNTSARRESDSSALNNANNREFKISLSATNYPLICGWNSDDEGYSSTSSAVDDTSSSNLDEEAPGEMKKSNAEEGASERVLQFTAHGSRAA